MKLFTALSLPSHIVNALAPFVVDQPLEKLHITLVYIGKVPDARVKEVQQAIASRKTLGPIQLMIEGIGYFPDATAPRVMWAGVSPVEPLCELKDSIREALDFAKVLGPADDKVYTPHITLARLNGIARGIIRRPEPFGYLEAESFHLYRSDGGVYTNLSSFLL